MRKVSIRELHIHTSELVRATAAGEIIVIERRGQPVAELRPLSAVPRLTAKRKALLFEAMQEIWNRMPPAGDSTKIIEEDRDR